MKECDKGIYEVIYLLKRYICMFVVVCACLLAGLSDTASAASVPVTNKFPENLVQDCMKLSIAQKNGIKLSDIENKPEASNIEGMDAWVSTAVRDKGRLLLTLQTNKEKDDTVMAIFLTMSYDEQDKNYNYIENMRVADDFLPILAEAIGMTKQDADTLFKTNFRARPSGAIYCENLGKTIVYQMVPNTEWKLIYFMIFASDQQPENQSSSSSESSVDDGSTSEQEQ